MWNLFADTNTHNQPKLEIRPLPVLVVICVGTSSWIIIEFGVVKTWPNQQDKILKSVALNKESDLQSAHNRQYANTLFDYMTREECGIKKLNTILEDNSKIIEKYQTMESENQSSNTNDIYKKQEALEGELLDLNIVIERAAHYRSVNPHWHRHRVWRYIIDLCTVYKLQCEYQIDAFNRILSITGGE